MQLQLLKITVCFLMQWANPSTPKSKVELEKAQRQAR